MSNEQAPTVPVKSINLGGGKPTQEGESRSAAAAGSSNVDKSVGPGSSRTRAEILANAREAKRIKNLSLSSTQDVQPDTSTTTTSATPAEMDNPDTESTSDPPDLIDFTTIPAKKKRAIFEALFGSLGDEDDTPEPPPKKPKTATEDNKKGTVANFLLDKTIDIARLAAASGAISIGMVVFKNLVGATPAQANNQDNTWVK